MKKQITSVFALLLLVLVLAACQAQTPPAATEAPTQTEAPVATATEEATVEAEAVETEAPAKTAYPEPQAEIQANQPYVEPQAAPLPGEPGYVSAYPEPESGDEITPLQALSLVLYGEVTEIAVSDQSQLTLTLIDGRSLVATVEDTEVYTEWLEKCGEKCADVEVVQ